MAVPKKKISKARRGLRQANDGLTNVNLGVCSNCQEPKMPHRVCQKCGWYDGRSVMTIKE